MSSTVLPTNASTIIIQVQPPAQTSAAVNTATPAHVQPVDGGFLGDGIKHFLKGQPKALGVVQIMIGVLTILLGIVLAVPTQSIYVFSGLPFWGSIIYIITGSLCVAAENTGDSNAKLCLVRGSLGMNITSAVTAGIAVIITSVDLGISLWNDYYCNEYSCYRMQRIYSEVSAGITGVLLVFSLLEFITSICLAGFSCKFCCCNSPQFVPHVVTQSCCSKPNHLYQNHNSEILVVNTASINQDPTDGLPPYRCEA